MAIVAKAHDGNVVVETRKETKRLQLRVRDIATGEWQRFPSGTTDIDAALSRGVSIFLGKPLEKDGAELITRRRFKWVCDRFKADLEREIRAGYGSQHRATQISIIRNYIDPFFGRRDTADIDRQMIDAYDRFVKDKLGRVPAKSTINSHYVVLRALFDYADLKKIRDIHTFPQLTIKRKGRSKKVRPEFTIEEMPKLMDFLFVWHRSPKRQHPVTIYKRRLLYCLVGFCFLTGVRAGKETDLLTWENVNEDFADVEGNRAVQIIMPHRKPDEFGEMAKVYAPLMLRHYLRRLRKLTKPTTSQAPLFSMPDGAVATEMSTLFRKALDECGLRYRNESDRARRRSRCLYSLRHGYAHYMLTHLKVDKGVLAANMGTSPQMIDEHYGHIRTDLAVAELTGSPVRRPDPETLLRQIVPVEHHDEYERMVAIHENLERGRNIDPIEKAKALVARHRNNAA